MRNRLFNQVQNIDAMLEHILHTSSGDQIQDIELMLETRDTYRQAQSFAQTHQTTTALRDHYDY